MSEKFMTEFVAAEEMFEMTGADLNGDAVLFFRKPTNLPIMLDESRGVPFEPSLIVRFVGEPETAIRLLKKILVLLEDDL